MKRYSASIAIISLMFAAGTAAAAGRGACPDGPQGEWAAWVDAMPGTTGPRLHVKGQVVTPMAGYGLKLRDAGLSGRKPYLQMLELVMRPPSGMSAQVITTQEVRFSAKAPPMQRPWRSPYRAIRILCGSRVIATIEPVTVAQ